MKTIFMNFNSSCSCNVYSDVSKGFTSRMLFDRILGSMNILRLQFTPVVIKINSMNFRRTLLLILLSCLLTFPAMAQFDDEIPEEVLTFQTRLEPEDPRPGILGFQTGLKGEYFFRNLIIELCHCRECKQAREQDQ